MKYFNFSRFCLGLSLVVILVTGCSAPAEKAPEETVPNTESEKTAEGVNPSYEIASPEYSEIAANSMISWTKFDFEAWTGFMSDDVIFYFPDGDAGTRTEISGKKALLDWWINWKQTSGIQNMTYINPVNIPVISNDPLPYTNLSGVFVISYFSNELNYNGTPINLRMNVTVHFNSDKLIDRIYTYYDRSKIIEVMKNNILAEGQN